MSTVNGGHQQKKEAEEEWLTLRLSPRLFRRLPLWFSCRLSRKGRRGGVNVLHLFTSVALLVLFCVSLLSLLLLLISLLSLSLLFMLNKCREISEGFNRSMFNPLCVQGPPLGWVKSPGSIQKKWITCESNGGVKWYDLLKLFSLSQHFACAARWFYSVEGKLSSPKGLNLLRLSWLLRFTRTFALSATRRFIHKKGPLLCSEKGLPVQWATKIMSLAAVLYC